VSARLLSLVALLLVPATVAAGPYYVRGDFHCTPTAADPGPGTTCWGWEAANEMFDDGLHADSLAGDGIYGAFVRCTGPAGRYEWKVATNTWSEAYPSASCCALANAVLFTTVPDEWLRFRFDTNFMLDSWQPFFDAVMTDHAVPPGVALEVIGAAPELGSWVAGVPLTKVGDRWQRVLTIATPGIYEFKIRVAGTWDVANFGYDYNNTQGDNAYFATTHDSSDVLFQYDEALGRVRGLELGPLPARRTSWGGIKGRYR